MPNSLAQLNSFSNQSYTFEDGRAYSITFSAANTSNQSVSVAEDVSFSSPVGINIISVISQPGNITYNINTGNIGNVSLTWPTLPNTVSSSTPSSGVYQVTGFIDDVVWNQIKTPTIVVKDRETNFSYTANIQYPSTANTANTSTWSWTNSVTISNTHSEMSNATGFTYDEDVAKTIPGTPTITDVYSGPLPHTLVITPNIANAVFSLSMSGNTSLNPVTKALTIVDTKANINTGLGNLWLVPAPDTNANYILNYSLTNPVSNLNTQVNQSANIGNINADFIMTTSYTYAEGASTQLVFSVDDGDPSATGFAISVNQTLGTPGIFFVNGVNAGIGNASGFSGNKAAFNGANITFMPNPDASDTINITANAYKTNASGNVTLASNVVSTITNTSSHGEFTLTTSYNFAEDATVPMIFSITDTDVNATNYVSTFTQTTGNTGAFIVNGTSQGVGNSAVLSNSRVNINAANVSFVPAPDATSNVALTYTQVKTNTYFGNITQANAVAISLTNNSSHAEYSLPASYNENTRTSAIQITDTDPNATNYQMSLLQTSGNTGSWIVGNSYYSAANSLLSLSNSRANINTANVQFMPAINDNGNVQLTFNLSKTNTYFGNIVQAANVLANLSVSTTYPGVDNMIARSYSANTVNDIFSSSTPAINDGPDYAQSYTITLTSALGKFGNSFANAVAANSYSFVGNNSQVNSEFANMKFVPNPNTSSSGSFTYTQSRDGVSQANTVLTLTGSQAFVTPRQVTYTANTSFSGATLSPPLTAVESYYYQILQATTVGGGGGGGKGKVSTSGGGGGGAGGQVVEGNISFNSSSTYTVVVGAGGAGSNAATNVTSIGYPGQNSYISTGNVVYFESRGGLGGADADGSRGGYGGDVRQPDFALLFSGGEPAANTFGGGGGGAGAAGNGGIGGDVNQGGTVADGGDGGMGAFSSIIGNTQRYGGGGGGGGKNVSYTIGGAAGAGGGGAGRGDFEGNGISGTNGLGGGGGGLAKENASYTPGAGGSGVVIIKIR